MRRNAQSLGHVCHRMTSLRHLLDCLDLELIRVLLAAHTDLPGCHKLWLEDFYERLAGPRRQNAADNRGIVKAVRRDELKEPD